MIYLNEWLFEFNIAKGVDGHHAIVRWLRVNGLSHLYTESFKAITYVVFRSEDQFYLIAKSSMPIEHAIVQKNEVVIDLNVPIKIAIQLSAKKRIRPPTLRHESPVNVRSKSIVRLMTEDEKQGRILLAVNDLGMDATNVTITVSEGIDLPVYHKREKLLLTEPTMNVVLEGLIKDINKFENAFAFGVGNKRVYGLGCVRVIQ